MLDKVIWLILLTFIPGFELRLSIPVGLFSGKILVPYLGEIQGFGLDPVTVFIVCVGANIILGPIAYFIWDRVFFIFLKINFIKKIYDWFWNFLGMDKKRAFIEKYGVYGVIFFVGVPLPGSGAWNGALMSSVVKIPFRQYLIGNIIGVIIAGILVMAISLGAFSIFP
jgi:uncharacterized membrane protein